VRPIGVESLIRLWMPMTRPCMSNSGPPESPAHYFGVPCRPAKNLDEFSAALDWAFAIDGPTVIEAFIDAGAYSATVFD